MLTKFSKTNQLVEINGSLTNTTALDTTHNRNLSLKSKWTYFTSPDWLSTFNSYLRENELSTVSQYALIVQLTTSVWDLSVFNNIRLFFKRGNDWRYCFLEGEETQHVYIVAIYVFNLNNCKANGVIMEWFPLNCWFDWDITNDSS